MDSRKAVFQESALVAIGQLICIGAMFGVFALLGQFDKTVLAGGILGGILAILNFFFMAVGTGLAADKAMNGDVKGGKGLLQSSYLLRTVILFVVLFAAVKSGFCNVFAILLPQIFTRPIITVGEFFRKKEEA